jgi:hypothetical protein
MLSSVSHKGLYRAIWRILAAVGLAGVLCLVSASPAPAQSLGEYFKLSYSPVVFDKTEIHGGEVFHAAVAGKATCSKDLPLPVGEAVITTRVIARHNHTGTEVTLNPGYTVIIKPFPGEEGDTVEISQTVPLQFPKNATSGNYTVVGRLVEANVKVGFLSPEVTPYLPQEQGMGPVQYIAPEPPPAPTAELAALEVTAPSPEPSASQTPAPTNPPRTAESNMPIWAEMIVLLAIGTTIFNAYWFLHHRQR